MKVLLLTGATGYVGGVVRAGLGHAWDITGVSSHASDLRNHIQCDLAQLDQVRRFPGA